MTDAQLNGFVGLAFIPALPMTGSQFFCADMYQLSNTNVNGGRATVEGVQFTRTGNFAAHVVGGIPLPPSVDPTAAPFWLRAERNGFVSFSLDGVNFKRYGRLTPYQSSNPQGGSQIGIANLPWSGQENRTSAAQNYSSGYVTGWNSGSAFDDIDWLDKVLGNINYIGVILDQFNSGSATGPATVKLYSLTFT
jgi:hypothetical protein